MLGPSLAQNQAVQESMLLRLPILAFGFCPNNVLMFQYPLLV